MSSRPSIFDLKPSGYAAWAVLDRLERKVDYAGNATLTQYDVLNRVSRITEADSYTIGFDRDPMGRITGANNQEGHRSKQRGRFP